MPTNTLRLSIEIPDVWFKKSQRAILEMLVRHPDDNLTGVALRIFTKGVDAVLEEGDFAEVLDNSPSLYDIPQWVAGSRDVEERDMILHEIYGTAF